MEINDYNDLAISSLTNGSKETTTYNNGSSLFNSLIAQNIDKKEIESSTQSLKGRVKDAIDNLKENISMTSSDTTNTHDELTLMLALKNMQAS